MLRIAIVDDIPQFCNDLQNMIETCSNNEAIEVEVYTFHSGEAFCDCWQNHHEFELVFFDIELPGMNGIEISQFLRESIMNEAVQIIFVSAKESYAMKLFKYRPFDFLVKPVTYLELSQCLLRYYRLFQNDKRYFHYHNNRKESHIDVAQILFFESEKKRIQMHTTGDVIYFYGKLDEVETELPENQFIRIHQSYLVNRIYITDFRFDSVTLKNGVVLGISRQYQSMVRKSLMLVQLERMRRGEINDVHK